MASTDCRQWGEQGNQRMLVTDFYKIGSWNPGLDWLNSVGWDTHWLGHALDG